LVQEAPTRDQPACEKDQQDHPTRHQPDFRAQKRGRDAVTAAAIGEQLDDLHIGAGDEKDGEGGGNRQKNRHMGMGAERQKRFFRTIVGRG
jgi:hypothetical protein